ncbi:Imm50 family immunity protein [Pseudomonas sp. TB1-B1]|uniref:Imm50 family immunity protein n=1 Tax=Pseudomonas sp. TB1-B1 TaxID=2985515 RepID=UPI0022714848|nr:Imm50 family immunity protein [Pseudomonas sp. TB1-B1]MCX9151248.1 immunity 50 family protein [Pseudomonas sp. TB1-B1]
MKYWNNLDGTIFFNKLFSHPIEIGKIYIHVLSIENDQSDLGIGFDISEFPDYLPEKWKDKGYNTCRLGLSCSEISNLRISNIPHREVFFAKIIFEDGHYFFNAVSKKASIQFKAKWLSLEGPSVYINCPEPDDHNWSDEI